ncbi:putative DNA-binding transcriptional regulator YafY [Crossiella equi]|uniref:DNA-binding transcriptional regulator YafY n=1 Tax=Crossiella equi TaxID=130796 RepID=A0ABS5A942_9PSEU|nr:YafY family protein [Crossiella equi]MBP2472836.1 putative DNA-binding transcriptional regulator YafY [Crossiella equi]
MRAARLLSLLLLLQTRGRLTAHELAQELEVSVRTVYRDVESLSSAGVPVYADRGPAGGYQLLDGYRTRLTGLTSTEAGALALAGLPDQAAELGLGTVLAAARLKLDAALPQSLREGTHHVSGRFHLDAPGWFTDTDRPPHLATLATAVWETRPATITYGRYQRPAKTTSVNPLGIVLKAGTWYLVAEADRIRTYRANRITSVTLDPAPFRRPADFDLAAYWREWSTEFESHIYKGTARIRMSPAAAWAAFTSGPVVAEAVRAVAPGADGWREVEVPIETLEIARADFLRYGPELEVLSPPELRAAVAESLRAAVSLYR